MEANAQKMLKNLSPGKVMIPVAIGLGVAIYTFITNVNLDEVAVHLSHANVLGLILAVFILFLVDAGYIYRLRSISGQELSWKSCIYIILLWEFATAVSPAFIGGTAVSIFLLNKEGLTLGKSLAYVLLAACLDNLFFMLIPMAAIFLSHGTAFPELATSGTFFDNGIKPTFYLSYGVNAFYACLYAFALFIRPEAIKWLMVKITSLKFLKKWQPAAAKNGDELILASQQLKGKKIGYWAKAIMATLFVWSVRFFILNSLLSAFSQLHFTDHLLIFARHLVMWVVMIISPTPGGSGVAEIIFPTFFRDFIGSFSVAVALFWRIITYYPYLIIGLILLPKWVKRVFITTKLATELKKAV